MKTASTVMIALCLLIGAKGQAAPREVSFDCVGLNDEGPLRPVVALDALLAQHPRSRRFRVTWSGSRLGTTALYDRHKQTLLVEKRDDVLLNDDENPPRRSAQLKRWLVSGVSQTRLHQLMHFYHDKFNENEFDEASSYFLQLKRFGCPVQVIADFERTYFVPQPSPKP